MSHILPICADGVRREGKHAYRQAVLHSPQSLGSVPLISTKIEMGIAFGSGVSSTCGPSPARE